MNNSNSNNYKKVFEKVGMESPSESIQRKVLERIHTYKMSQIRFGAYFYGLTSILSLAALWPISSAFLTEISRTDFFSYASLLLYDGAHLNEQWRYWAASLATAFPFSGILVLFIVIAALHSLNKLTFCLSAIMAEKKPAKNPKAAKAGNIIGLSM